MKNTVWRLLISCLLCNQCLAQSAFIPSLGKGIQLEAADSTLAIKISARIQNLVIVESPINLPGKTETRAMVRRARLKFDGYALSPRLTYKIELGLSSRDIGNSADASLVSNAPKIIYDAVLKYQVHKSTSIWFGQAKLPGNRERVISSQKLQFVDRSLVNSSFNIDRDFGFQVRNEFSLGKLVVRPIAAISLGDGRNVTTRNNGGFDYTARLEFLPMGEFASKGDYFSSDLSREQKPKLSIGITADYNQGAIRQRGQLGRILADSNGAFIENDLQTGFIDLMFKYRGFSVLAEAAHKTASSPNLVDATGTAYGQGFGYTAQAGYLFKSNFEMAARYTRVGKISGTTSSISNREQYTIGASKYFQGHNLKLQTDLTYEQVPSATFANGNLIFRFQTELAF